MKTKLFYFSGTGNSYWVAKELGTRIGESELLSIPQSGDERFDLENTGVGIVCPLYFLSFPKIVMEFIQKQDFESADYVFIVVTMGWTLKGGIFGHARELMGKGKPDLGMYIQMPMNDIIYVNLHSVQGQQKILQQAGQRLDRIAAKIIKREKKIDWEPLSIIRKSRHQPFIKSLTTNQDRFRVTAECTQCRICAKVCPVHNIEFVSEMPVWGNRCEECEACLHYCPARAVEFGPNTATKGRYVNPNLTLDERLKI